MFENLKTKANYKSVFKDKRNPASFSISPGASSAPLKGNEASRLGRCRHCGWICDRERDVRMPDGVWAGLGVVLGSQLTAGASVGDRRVPVSGSVATTVDQYYAREVVAGCPACGSFTWDERG